MTFIDTYTKVGFAKLYTEKTPITAADLLNDRVLPFFDQHGIPLSRVLTDRGTEYCRQADRHPYELVSGARRHRPFAHQDETPADQWHVERFDQTLLNEFYRVAFRKRST